LTSGFCVIEGAIWPIRGSGWGSPEQTCEKLLHTHFIERIRENGNAGKRKHKA